MKENDLVTISHLSKQFSPKLPKAIDNITASIPRGKIVGLVGPDGAGKTTLIRLIAGLMLPTDGKITIEGFDSVENANEIHAITGYMPQKFGLYEDLTVMQNLSLYADLREIPEKEKKEKFDYLLDFTGLKPFTTRLARNLSGGMKQKLGLACALIEKPTLLLLDEPSVGVDPISRRELWKMVTSLLKENISVLWSTAYLDEAEKCDLVLLINDGKLIYNGTPQDITKRAFGRVFKIENLGENRREVLSSVLQDENVLDGVIQGSDVRLVLKDKSTRFAFKNMIEVTPRFEDAFIDILGGIHKRVSELAMRQSPILEKTKIAIRAEGLTKKFGSFTAANNISFEVKRGEIFGLLGPNGAGKSTTFKMLCGLLKPTHGRAFVNNYDLQVALGEARSFIGYMSQKYSLYGNLNVLQNLEFFSGIYGLEKEEKKRAIKEMIEIFNLAPFLETSSDLLPLGYKQRLSLAAVAMHHPEIIFLDEPTSGVDPLTRREFWTHINGLVEKGVTIMVTTHFMEEAEYCDRIALIYRGEVIELKTPDDLKASIRTDANPNPTLEDAFIKLIEEYDEAHPQ